MAKFTEKLRKMAFGTVDALKGGHIQKHVDEIATSIAKGSPERAEKLQKILQHAVNTVPIYKGISPESIENFRVMDKNFIRENSASFLSSAFEEHQRIAAVTSGSTGTPFKVFHDRNKKSRNSADTIYFASRAGFSVGEKLYYFKIWSALNHKSFSLRYMQNITPVDVIHLDDNQIEKLIKEIENDGSDMGFLGYSSALELVARYLDKTYHGPVKAKVNSIISMSEGLNEYTKNTLTKFFGTQAVSRYSNIENGIIAQQETDGLLRFRINTASYHIEILGMDSDIPVKKGKLGRIVVTDFYNYAMPMIRYDTGDIGCLSTEDDNYLQTIEGRKLDLIYDTKGDLISSYIVYKNMWQYVEINQYQFVQYGPKDYLFKVNSDSAFGKEEKLVAEFKQYLGKDANFKVEYVDEIPLLSSGKRKKIMNTYHNK
ncbi:phenylacetate--CoA ligase family protein [Flavobacterium pallidum]|uniref:CoF synthetase n=1 Tax=Flavobacterium pallidum TaxID=2172098 RepID=A0A2S1SDH6_9FLAO|nr:phenylacetate--CoA ligase family protein [Flavobacterium pallidum]AWI24441.1 CoF synthetase [Flavobacterium pallidum]